MEMSLSGKTALITGSTGHGMGRSIAFKFATLGANIVLNYGTHKVDEEARKRAEEVAGHVERLGGKALIVPGDTRREETAVEMVKRAEETFGGIDILVVNAGGVWNSLSFQEMSLEQWRSCVEAELDGMFLALKHVLPGMRERKFGRIMVMSMNGAVTRRTLENTGIDYTAAKTARTWLSLAVGHDEWDNGITVNVFEIGPMQHMKLPDALSAVETPEQDWVNRTKPAVHDAAEMAAFLCSEAGRFISQSLIRYPSDGW